MSAIDERARLFSELSNVQEAADLAANAQASASAELDRADTAAKLAYEAQARGLATEQEVTALERRIVELKRDVGAATLRAQGALDARRAIDAELGELYVRCLPEFTAEAEELTRRAAAALEVLQVGYEAAWAAWSVAQARWRPLMPAIRDEIDAAFRAIGQQPDPSLFVQLANVPPCPLPLAGAVFGSGVEPRPLGYDEDGMADIGDGVLSGAF